MKPIVEVLYPGYIIPIIGPIPETVSKKRKQHLDIIRTLTFKLTPEKDKDGLPIYEFDGIY
jgi:hypothetical protein